jgi:hypothetical protein
MPLAPIRLAALHTIGVGLQRPEDVVVSRDHRGWAEDQASACAEILPGNVWVSHSTPWNLTVPGLGP